MGHVEKAKSKANMDPSVEISGFFMISQLLHALVENVTTSHNYLHNPMTCTA